MLVVLLKKSESRDDNLEKRHNCPMNMPYANVGGK